MKEHREEEGMPIQYYVLFEEETRGWRPPAGRQQTRRSGLL